MASKKELRAEIDILKTRIALLEARIQVLEASRYSKPWTTTPTPEPYKITWNPPYTSTAGPFFPHRYIYGGKYS